MTNIQNPTPKIDNSSRLALMMHDNLASNYGKMGHGLLRYSEAEITAVVDRAAVGRTVWEVIGIDRNVPIVATVTNCTSVYTTMHPSRPVSIAKGTVRRGSLTSPVGISAFSKPP